MPTRQVNSFLLTSSVLLGLYGAGAIPIVSSQATFAQIQVEARQHIKSWLECGLCDEDELAPVRTHGKTDIEVVRTLATALQDGPADGEIEVMRSDLLIAYRKIQAPKQTRDAFITTYLDKYLDAYRTRAAEALGAIGTEESRKALSDAKKKHHSSRVLNAINDALNKPD